MADVVAAGQAEQIARLRLIRSENVGPVTFRQLITRFGNGRAALDALPGLARRGGRPSLRIVSAAQAEAEMAAVERFGGRMLFCRFAPYPRLLAEIDDAPPVIAARGHVTLLDRPAMAMVGARSRRTCLPRRRASSTNPWRSTPTTPIARDRQPAEAGAGSGRRADPPVWAAVGDGPDGCSSSRSPNGSSAMPGDA